MIDLAKLKAFELPTTEADIFLLGEMQKVTIRAMKQTTSVKFTALDEKIPDDKLTAIALIISDALGISEDDARRLCDVDFEAATDIANKCGEFTKEYNDKCRKEREIAEKNLQAARVNTPAK